MARQPDTKILRIEGLAAEELYKEASNEPEALFTFDDGSSAVYKNDVACYLEKLWFSFESYWCEFTIKDSKVMKAVRALKSKQL